MDEEGCWRYEYKRVGEEDEPIGEVEVLEGASISVLKARKTKVTDKAKYM